MAVDANDWRVVFMPESQVTEAKGMVNVLRNRYWAVHPENGLLFWQTLGKRKGKLIGAAPQCNADESIAIRVIGKMFPWAEIRFIPLVMAPIDVSDYE